jgi:CDP-6-deoxy-D-xylo-4-hexulose-3-dehydrase
VQAKLDNRHHLRANLAACEEFFDFMLPTHARSWRPRGFQWDDSGHRTLCSWFGFIIRVRSSAPFTRRALAESLEAAQIEFRMLFGGNLVRQPAFLQLRRDGSSAFRAIGDLAGSDRIMNESLFIGVYPGLTRQMTDYMVEVITDSVRDETRI